MYTKPSNWKNIGIDGKGSYSVPLMGEGSRPPSVRAGEKPGPRADALA